MAKAGMIENQLALALQNSKLESSNRWRSPMPEPDRMLRLLKLSGGLRPDDEIELELGSYKFDESPSYNALSYTWGCPVVNADEIATWDAWKGRISVVCNEVRVQIGRNLRLALQHLLMAVPGTLLWVDALCIDQDNLKEKSIQIARMGEIYGSAQVVLAWLGPTYGKMSMLELCYQNLPSSDDKAWEEPAAKHAEIQSRLLQRTTISQRSQALDEISRLLTLRWWNRNWTYQELMLAPAVRILHGGIVYWPDRLSLLMNLLVKATPPVERLLRQKVSLMRRTSACSRLSAADMYLQTMQDKSGLVRFLDKQSGCSDPLAILMKGIYDTAHSEATEPKDKILSLIGVTKLLAQRLGQSVDLSFITARSSDIDVRISVTKKLILRLPFLKILALAGFDDDDDDDGAAADANIDADSREPSWVAKFRHSSHLGTFSNQQYSAGLDHKDDKATYLSGRSFAMVGNLSTSPVKFERLQLQAIMVGTVEHTQRLLEFLPEGYLWSDVSSQFKLIMAMASFCRKLPASCLQNRDPSAICRTLFFGSPSANADSFRSWVISTFARHWYDMRRSGSVSLEPYWITNPPTSDIFSGLQYLVGEDLDTVVFALIRELETSAASGKSKLAELQRKAPTNDSANGFSQTLFSMNEDRIGVTARLCCESDQIWVLRGGDYPYILRPTKVPNHFQLVGQAYVDDIMRGEYMTSQGSDPKWAPLWII